MGAAKCCDWNCQDGDTADSSLSVTGAAVKDRHSTPYSRFVDCVVSRLELLNNSRERRLCDIHGTMRLGHSHSGA